MDDAPELAALLAKVDRAVADGDLEAALTSLDDLVSATTEAEAEGRIEATQAEAIVAAAARLESRLPRVLKDGEGQDPPEDSDPASPQESTDREEGPDESHEDGPRGEQGNEGKNNGKGNKQKGNKGKGNDRGHE